ncbi:hypothetical protein CASFOL_041159 [Castilleja foliolosa]|uniref:Uncharacterized protein n=1 Tax=Castilleja foliolosa TaxID=1961234 RepID=A0ABD3BE61_9LAMI
MGSANTQSVAYPSAARISDSDCYPAYTASLKLRNLIISIEIELSRISVLYIYVDWQTNHNILTDCPFTDLSTKIASLEVFSTDKSKCQEHFDIYKECRKKEREERLERNRSRSLFS